MMKRVGNWIVNVLVIVGLLIPITVDPLVVKAESKANTLGELKQELAKLKEQKAYQDNQKNLTQKEINQNIASIQQADNEKEKVRNEVTQAENRIVESEEEISKVTEETKSLLKYFQLIEGENEYIEYITKASSMTELIMRISAVEQIADYNQRKLHELDDLVKENEQLKVELAEKEKELEAKIEASTEAISSLRNQLSALNEINEDINSQINNQQALIKYYEGVCTSDDQLLSDCIKVASNAGWTKPLVKGRVTSPWGYRVDPITGAASSFHNAVDIGGNPEGTPIYAGTNGTVAAITRKSSCGGNIIYIHSEVQGKAYTIQYAHVLDVYVNVGDTVTINDVIATVGGGPKTWSYERCSTGAHLHYGISTGYYLGGGPYGYSSFNKFVASSVQPVGFPALGIWWYSRW